MKWIGQHIWDFISRFRSDVYLEDLAESAQDHVVGIDDDGKLYKQDVSVGDITGVTAGDALTGGGDSGALTINHEDTSTQASVNNSGRTYIQDVSLDTYGHVTSLTSATETGQPLIYSEITIDANEMSNLHVTRKTLVAAQGANTMIVPVSCMVRATKLNSGVNNTTLANVAVGYGDDLRDLTGLPIMFSKGLLYRFRNGGTLHVAPTGAMTGDISVASDADCVDVELAMCTSADVGSNGASASKVSLLYYVATTS